MTSRARRTRSTATEATTTSSGATKAWVGRLPRNALGCPAPSWRTRGSLWPSSLPPIDSRPEELEVGADRSTPGRKVRRCPLLWAGMRSSAAQHHVLILADLPLPEDHGENCPRGGRH